MGIDEMITDWAKMSWCLIKFSQLASNKTYTEESKENMHVHIGA